jgi:hypothetical protein
METKIEPDEPVQKVIPPCDTCAVLPGSIYCDTCPLKETRKEKANRERPKRSKQDYKRPTRRAQRLEHVVYCCSNCGTVI